MMIRRIKMVNFRGFRQKNLDFQSKNVVLLSASNGMGKTTTADAIEWCLTGNIGRLKASFDTRSTNNDDRKWNSPGILKNRYADPNAEVIVELTLFDNKREFVLCRKQRHDVLDSKYSSVSIDNSSEKADKFLREYIGDGFAMDSFYNFHFCDIQKSFHVQNTKRSELKDFFSEFITNYDMQKQIAENLKLFAMDTERLIENIRNNKIPQAKIQHMEEELAKACEGAKLIPYPATVLYPGEKTDITGLNQAALIAQQKAVRNCGFLVAKAALDKLVNNESLRRQHADLRAIVFHWETKGTSIQRAIDVGFPKKTDTITDREQKLRILQNLNLSMDTILSEGETVASLGNKVFTRTDFEAIREAIVENLKKESALTADIDLLTKNNEMLKLLSSLSVKKQVLIDYRNSTVAEHGSARCPVCGSEIFADLDENSILSEANAYIRQNGETVKAKQEEKALLQTKIGDLYQNMILRAKHVVEEEVRKMTDEINGLKDLRDEVQPYFDTVKRLQKILPAAKPAELTAETAAQLLADTECALLDETLEQTTRAEYQKLLTVLGHPFERETLEQTHARVTHLISGIHEVANFSYDLFVSKLNSIDSFLANQTYLNLKKQLDSDHQTNSKLDAKINELQALGKTASQRAENILKKVEELSNEEYARVGPTLKLFYNKLARINATWDFRIEQHSGGVSLVDQDGNNIVNMLSNGQISVFILAYFFATMNERAKREKMKIFFIDDLSACMDDVNMLAFLDILKYQMSAKETMEQLFFITCDERISKLLKYKLSGRGIELCEIGEADFLSTPAGSIVETV